MAAMWPSKTVHPPISRQVNARSLDGYRLSAELVVSFRKSADEVVAVQLVDEIARIAAHVLGEQISQGRFPLTGAELADGIRKRMASATSKVTEIEVTPLDRTGAAVQRDSPPPRQDSGARTAAPPARKDVTRPSAATPAPSASPPPSRKGTSGSWSALPRDPAIGARSSGSALSAPPRTLWIVSLSKCSPGTSLGEIANALGPALRDSTAALLLRILIAMDPAVTDRLGLFDGRGPVPALRTEIGACLAAGFGRLIVITGVEASTATKLALATASRALGNEAPSGPRIESYATSESPIRDLARRAASIVGTPDDAAAMYALLSPYCEALRAHLELVGKEIARLKPR